MSSVALTFFAFLGFGVITFTAKDLANPSRQLPQAVYLALGIATVVYVAVALGVFGTPAVDEVIESGGTALAVAAEPVLGTAGYWLMSVTALFATAGATNAGLYPAAGLCASRWRRPASSPLCSGAAGGRATCRILVMAAVAIVLAVGFDLDIDRLDRQRGCLGRVHAGDRRPSSRPRRDRTRLVLVLAIVATVVVLVTFAFTTLVDEPGTAVALIVILLWPSRWTSMEAETRKRRSRTQVPSVTTTATGLSERCVHLVGRRGMDGPDGGTRAWRVSAAST